MGKERPIEVESVKMFDGDDTIRGCLRCGGGYKVIGTEKSLTIKGTIPLFEIRIPEARFAVCSSNTILCQDCLDDLRCAIDALTILIKTGKNTKKKRSK